MSRTRYKTEQEVIDAIKAMREYPRWSEKTSYTQTAEEVVDEADRVCTGQAPPCWSWNMVAKVANIEYRMDGKFHRVLKRSWA